jgi:hypothetical protein
VANTSHARNRQVSGRYCARICARDAAGWGEMGRRPDSTWTRAPTFAEVSTAAGDQAARWRRPSYCS